MLVIFLLVILVIIVLSCVVRENFTGMPSHDDKLRLVNKALARAELFNPKHGRYLTAKSHIAEIDNVIYEDFRNLARSGNFNQQSLLSALQT